MPTGSSRRRRPDPSHETRFDDVEVEQLAALLTHVVSAGVDLAIASASTAGLTLTQFRALAIVAEHAPLRLTALAAKLGVTPSSATQTCDRLISAGLIQRSRNPTDQRVVQLVLSDLGRALVVRVRGARNHQVREVLEQLPEVQRQDVLSGLAALAEAMGAPTGDHAMFGWS